MTLQQLMRVLDNENVVWLVDSDGSEIDCYNSPSDISSNYFDLEVEAITARGDSFFITISLPRYNIECRITATAYVCVRAKTEYEALEKADELIGVSCGSDCIDLEVDTDRVDDYDVSEANIEFECADLID